MRTIPQHRTAVVLFGFACTVIFAQAYFALCVQVQIAPAPPTNRGEMVRLAAAEGASKNGVRATSPVVDDHFRDSFRECRRKVRR